MTHRIACAIVILALAWTDSAIAQRRRPADSTSQPASQPVKPIPPAQARAAMAELWRRGSCLLSNVIQPAQRTTATPTNIGSVPALLPRVIGYRGDLLCHAVDGSTIWVADDQTLYQVDASRRTVAKVLPLSEAVHGIQPAGDSLWLVHPTGLARLDRASGNIQPVPGISFNLARIAAGGGRVWLLSDGGAFSCPVGRTEWTRLPDFPGQAELAGHCGQGFWLPLWPGKLRTSIPWLHANDDGLYAICANQLIRFDHAEKKWSVLCDPAWQAIEQGRNIWALTTGAVHRFDAATGQSRTFEAGDDQAAGRSVSMAASDDAFFLISHPDYDSKAGKFVGGGISRYDTKSARWTITESADGVDVRLATAVLVEGDEVWVAVRLYDRVSQIGAHPGMAHVKRWIPHVTGIGLLRLDGQSWRLMKREGLKTADRWVLGQRNTLGSDKVGPDSAVRLCRAGGSLWGLYHIVPESWYSGYFFGIGRLAEQQANSWQGRFDWQPGQCRLDGEQPDVMLLSASHGPEFVLAEGCPEVLDIISLGDRAWAVCQSGLFVADESGNFVPVVEPGYRFYWTVTAAAADDEAVYFGGDGGTLSRLNPSGGRVEMVGILAGRKVDKLLTPPRGKGVAVVSSKMQVRLPAALEAERTGLALPDGDTYIHSATNWPADSALPPQASSRFACKGNFLMHGNSQIAFLRGVFNPVVLCEDPARGVLWLAVYGGVASIPLPDVPTTQPR